MHKFILHELCTRPETRIEAYLFVHDGAMATDEEWAAGHLAGASYISFDWDHRLDPLKALPEDRPVLVYCEAGGRSGVITEELRILGHPYIVDLIGGMEAWSENDRPVAFDEPVALP